MKTTITISVDMDIAAEAKDKLKGEMSIICEEALAKALKKK